MGTREAISSLVFSILCIIGPAHAEEFGWTLTTTSSANFSTGVDGTEFTPNVDIQITALGWYDDILFSPNGLDVSHAVGVYRVDNQQLLASVTVPAGTAAPKDSQFRFAAITPVNLQAGVKYVVAGVINNDYTTLATPGSTLLVNPLLTVGAWRTGGGSSLAFPASIIGASTRSLGATFKFVQKVADHLLWTLDPASQSVTGSGMIGTEFTPRSDILVKSLGWYDDTYSTLDGLASTHQIGLFNAASGALLVSGTLAAGTGTPKVNQFRMMSVTASRLRAGVPYVVAGLSTGDPRRVIQPGADMHIDAAITLGPWRVGGAGFSFPQTIISAETRSASAIAGFEPVPTVQAWNITSANHTNNSTGVMGTEFTPQASIQVASLGWYDDTLASANGLAASHSVAIYRVSDRVQVASGVVPAGTGTRKVGWFRFVDITPVTLTGGLAYVIAGLFDGDGRLNVTPGSTLTVDSTITLGPWRMGGTTMGFPDFVSSATTRTVGPTFEFIPPAVDSDHDGIPDAEDLCPGTPLGRGVDAGGCPTAVPGDFNGDLDIDVDDLAHMGPCFSGPRIPLQANCSWADLDKDGDVDQIDFGRCQACVSANGVAADPACMAGS